MELVVGARIPVSEKRIKKPSVQRKIVLVTSAFARLGPYALYRKWKEDPKGYIHELYRVSHWTPAMIGPMLDDDSEDLAIRGAIEKHKILHTARWTYQKGKLIMVYHDQEEADDDKRCFKPDEWATFELFDKPQESTFVQDFVAWINENV